MAVRFKSGTPESTGPAGFTDDYDINIIAPETVDAQSDEATFEIELEQSDTVATQTEQVEVGFPAGVWVESNTAPSETNSFTMIVWLSNGSVSGNGVSNATNSESHNDGSVTTFESQVAGDATNSITYDLGANIPSGVTLTAIDFRGWFKSVNNLVTSDGAITIISDGGLFSDIEIFSNSALDTTIDYLDGSFTHDVDAESSIDTETKIRSIQLLVEVSDVAAGVTPHVFTLDAGCLEITGAFT